MPVVQVTDPADPAIADYSGLTDVALRTAHEPATGLYMAEGAKVIARALAAGHRPRSMLVERKRLAEAQSLADPGTLIYTGTEEVVRAITGYRVHRGFLAAMNRPAPRSVAEVTATATRVLILEDLVDHTNVGAAFRNAAALGFDAVLVSPRCADPLYRRSIKVSMGAVLAIGWARPDRWPQPLVDLRTGGFTILGLTPAASASDLATVRAPARLALLVGTEGAGLSPRALACCDLQVRIPMAGGIDSLNVAAATAVACYSLAGSG